jgi:hypothetical protein
MRYLIPAVVLGVLLIYFIFTGGDETGEIEAVFNEIIEAAREKDEDGVLEHFSLHYRDKQGYNYLVIKKIIDNAFSKFDTLDGSYGNISVSLGEDENGEKLAFTKVGVKAVGVREGIPETLLGSGDSYDNIMVTLKKSTFSGWKIIEIEGVDKYGNSENY